ncbi:MAG: sugar transferase [Candidatus Saccharimonadales bacterium]
MKNNASLVYSLFLVFGDFTALVVAFASAFIVRVSISSAPISHPVHAITYIWLFISLVPFWLLIFALLGLYSNAIYEKRFPEIGRLFMGSFVGFLFVLGIAYFSNQPIFPAKLVPIYGFIFGFLFLVLFRNLARFIRSILFLYNIGITKVLIIGDTHISDELIDSLIDNPSTGYHVVGLISTMQIQTKHGHKLPIFKDIQTAVDKIGVNNIHSIVQTELFTDPDKNNQLLNFAQQNHIAFRFIPGNTELFVGNIEVELFRSSVPVIAVHQTPLIGWGRITKRTFDFIVCLIALVVALPFIIIIALFVKIFGGGSVFFRQVRLTRFNREFKVFKFRTQYAKYDGTTPEEAFELMGKPYLAVEYRKNGDCLTHDPRITPLGRFLRKTSLDELPQLFNVLRGDLSLVGPRALIPQELSLYEKRHAILSVKSGLTGLAQVSGRRRITFDQRRQLDMYYVQNWTFWLDIILLLKTIRVIVTGDGAQ